MLSFLVGNYTSRDRDGENDDDNGQQVTRFSCKQPRPIKDPVYMQSKLKFTGLRMSAWRSPWLQTVPVGLSGKFRHSYKYSVMQLWLYLYSDTVTTKPDAKKREIIANLLTYPSEVSSTGWFFFFFRRTNNNHNRRGHTETTNRRGGI